MCKLVELRDCIVDASDISVISKGWDATVGYYGSYKLEIRFKNSTDPLNMYYAIYKESTAEADMNRDYLKLKRILLES